MCNSIHYSTLKQYSPIFSPQTEASQVRRSFCVEGEIKMKKTKMQQGTSHATHTSDFYAKLQRTHLQTVVCSATKANKDKTRRDVRVFLQARLLTEAFE